MSILLGIYGASGCGRGILPLLAKSPRPKRGAWSSSTMAPPGGRSTASRPWMGGISGSAGDDKSVAIAIANSPVRERLADRCIAAQIRVIGARADNVIEMDDVQIGEGALLSPFVTLTSNIRIGRAFHANFYSYVEHDCVIGDFVTFAPASAATATSISTTTPTSARAP